MHSTNARPPWPGIGFVVGSIALAACSDDGKPSGPIVAAPAEDAATSTGPKKSNAEVGCARNEDCESGVCFVGGGQAFCTVKCTAENVATLCVSPFTGSCNKQGYCKRD